MSDGGKLFWEEDEEETPGVEEETEEDDGLGQLEVEDDE